MQFAEGIVAQKFISATYISPWEDEKMTKKKKSGKQKEERMSVFDKTSTASYHIVFAEVA